MYCCDVYALCIVSKVLILFLLTFFHQPTKPFNISDKESKIAFYRILLVFDMIFPFCVNVPLIMSDI